MFSFGRKKQQADVTSTPGSPTAAHATKPRTPHSADPKPAPPPRFSPKAPTEPPPTDEPPIDITVTGFSRDDLPEPPCAPPPTPEPDRETPRPVAFGGKEDGGGGKEDAVSAAESASPPTHPKAATTGRAPTVGDPSTQFFSVL